MPSLVHTDVWFLVVAVTGVVALLACVGGWIVAPDPTDPPDWVGVAAIYGVPAAITGCIGAPLIFAIARRDRAALALVRAHRPRSLALPGAVSNHALMRSIRALDPSELTPRSVVWAVDERGMELWQSPSPTPVLSLPWSDVLTRTVDDMPQGRAVITIAVLELTSGHRLALAFRRRFGGITLMGPDRVDSVLRRFADLAAQDGGTGHATPQLLD